VSLLCVDQLTIRYRGKPAVDRLSFTVDRGEAVGLVGESGSGKSQTALAVLGLLPADAEVTGSVRVSGTEVIGAGESALNEIRARRVGIVFQDPMQALNPFVRVGRQLRQVVLRHGIAAGAAADARVVELLARVGLPDPQRQFRAYPHQLSGGMRQRVMLAQALIAEPDLLIADEPTTALDVTVQAQILALLEDIRQDTALLLITHDLGVVAGYCERMLVLEDGRLVEQGATRDVFAAPAHEHTQALIAAAPRIDQAPAGPPRRGAEVLVIESAKVVFRVPGEGALEAVRGVDLSLTAGETVAVVGESGSGKSSLVRAVLGLVPMRGGRVTYCGVALPAAVQARAQATRRDLQLVFQDPVGSLNPQMRVEELVGEPLVVHEPRSPASRRRERVAGMLDQVGLGEEYLDRYPHQLSGGQAQRVAIARALILEPKVLVCDEAVAALDGTVREQILRLLQRVQAATGLAIVFITHDLAVVRTVSHRVCVMYLGRLVELAENAALFAHARHPYTRALLAAVPLPDPAAPGGRALLSGEIPSAVSPPPGCAFHPRCPHVIDTCRRVLPEPRRIGEATVACHRADEPSLQGG
jgi:peptide/nickel transport system ATP-binding protein